MLTPAPKPIVPIDRRVRDRIVLDVPITLQFGVDAAWLETDARLIDLSLDGMLIRCDRVPSLCQRVFLVVEHAFVGECVALGSPVRFASGGFGVRFEHTNDLMQELIRNLSKRRDELRRYLSGTASDLRVTISGMQ